jgi:tetratricopeptide (TPR) repeat protein
MKLNRDVILLSAVCAFFALFFSLAVPTAAPAQSSEALFQQGNDLYGQGKYQEALHVYSRIIAENGFSGPLLSNLANCYAQTGRAGLAILNYERALRLSPGDSDSRGNLDLLRKNLGLFQEELPLARHAASLLNLDQWTLLAGVFLVLLTLINLAGLRFSNGKQVRRWLGGLCLVVLLAATAGAVSQYRQLDQAVVISNDAHLLLSPFPASSSVGVIAEGRIVSTLQQHGLYSLVEDQAGRTGWLEKDKIASIDGIATGLKDHQDKKGSAQ